MRFAVTGKYVVGPDTLAIRRVRSGGRSGWRSGDAVPIFRRIGDSPHVCLVVERDSDQKVFPVLAQWQTIGNAARCGSAARQITQQYGSLDGQRLRRANPAALWTDHKRHTLGCERMPPVHAGHDQRNLHPQSSAAASRLGCEYLHLPGFRHPIY